MLESATQFSLVFNRMGEEDEEYKNYFKKRVRIDSSRGDSLHFDPEYDEDNNESTFCPPNENDWLIASEFMGFLQQFYTMTLKFSGSNYVTSNTCFQHIVAIETKLRSSASKPTSLLKVMATKMLSKLEKYWGKAEKMNPLLIVGTILDPRYKMTYVRVAFDQLFPDRLVREDMEEMTMSVLHRLYDYYCVVAHPNVSSSQSIIEQEGDKTPDNDAQDVVDLTSVLDPAMQAFIAKADQQSSGEKISELDEYLRADLISFRDPKFDILTWWKVNASKYPILSLAARDVLAVPVSTVPSESTFSTGGRLLDAFRSSLSSKVVEGLICVKDWICKKPANNEIDIDNIDECYKIVEGIFT